jgi:hypothetical protein
LFYFYSLAECDDPWGLVTAEVLLPMRLNTDTVTRTATGKRTAARTKIVPVVIFFLPSFDDRKRHQEATFILPTLMWAEVY